MEFREYLSKAQLTGGHAPGYRRVPDIHNPPEGVQVTEHEGSGGDIHIVKDHDTKKYAVAYKGKLHTPLLKRTPWHPTYSHALAHAKELNHGY